MWGWVNFENVKMGEMCGCENESEWGMEEGNGRMGEMGRWANGSEWSKGVPLWGGEFGLEVGGATS